MQTQEAIKTFLLKKKSNTKLDIFLFLSEHHFFITTQYLADHFHMSESNFLLYIKELEQDFERLNLTELHIDKQKPFLKLNFEGIDPAYCYYRLFGRYCNESVSYQILTSLFSCQTNSIISFSQQTNYSASYLYTKMKKINAFLALYGLSISFSNNGRKSFSGKEVQIQYAALDIYWNIFSSTATEFYDEDPQVVAFMMNTFFKKEVLDRLNSGMIDKLYFLLKICKENFPATSVKDVQKEFTEYEYIDFFIDLSVDILRPNLPICREQRILVNILARLSITKIESEETSLEQYKLLKKANVPHVLYSREMVESFCTVFDLFIPEKEKILYSLAFARNKLYNGFLNFNQPNTPLPTFMLYQEHSVLKEVQTAIEQFYMDFREQNQHLLPVILEKENVQWMVEDLVHLYDRYKKQPRIVIGVNYTRDFYISKDLIIKIEQIFSNESIKIQNDFMENCNIVISDCPLKQLPSHIKKIYILKGIITPEDWKKVIMRISEYIFELKEEALMDQSKKENQVTS